MVNIDGKMFKKQSRHYRHERDKDGTFKQRENLIFITWKVSYRHKRWLAPEAQRRRSKTRSRYRFRRQDASARLSSAPAPFHLRTRSPR